MPNARNCLQLMLHYLTTTTNRAIVLHLLDLCSITNTGEITKSWCGGGGDEWNYQLVKERRQSYLRLESTLAREALPAVGDKDSRIWRALPRLRDPLLSVAPDSIQKVLHHFSPPPFDLFFHLLCFQSLNSPKQ